MASEPPIEARGRSNVGASGDISLPVDGLSDDQIRERAYLIWIDEGGPQGRELDYRLRAKWERENAREE